MSARPACLCGQDHPEEPEAAELAALRQPLPPGIATAARARLWELDHQHHCVLLGGAFEPRELRQLFRRIGYEDWESAPDWELHSTAVAWARSRNALSKLMQKRLDERYAAAIARLRPARSREQVIGDFRHWAAAGDPVGAYWAAITHPECDASASELLARNMHMLAHLLFAERRAMGRRLRTVEERAAQVEQALARCQRHVEELRRSLATERAARGAAEQAARAAQAELARIASGAAGREREAREAGLRAERDQALRSARVAERRLAAARREIDALRLEVEGVPGVSAPVPVDSADCAARRQKPDLGSRMVLCVGGKTGLLPAYREAVESARGVFVHHDGGIEDNLARLPALLGSADAVVCLAGSVSHGAYYAVKRYCKRFGKPCALAAGASVAALAQSLDCVARGGVLNRAGNRLGA
ncbi:MAG: DUF2325 domain-containing protein [Pseudomonadota bacterium]